MVSAGEVHTAGTAQGYRRPESDGDLRAARVSRLPSGRRQVSRGAPVLEKGMVEDGLQASSRQAGVTLLGEVGPGQRERRGRTGHRWWPGRVSTASRARSTRAVRPFPARPDRQRHGAGGRCRCHRAINGGHTALPERSIVCELCERSTRASRSSTTATRRPRSLAAHAAQRLRLFASCDPRHGWAGRLRGATAGNPANDCAALSSRGDAPEQLDFASRPVTLHGCASSTAA